MVVFSAVIGDDDDFHAAGCTERLAGGLFGPRETGFALGVASGVVTEDRGVVIRDGLLIAIGFELGEGLE